MNELKMPSRMLNLPVGLLIGVGYAAGFVVVNASTGVHHPAQYHLLSGQYFAAAILFFSLSAIPILFGLVVGRDYYGDEITAVRSERSVISRALVTCAYFLLATLAVLFFPWQIENLLFLDGSGPFRFVYILYFLMVFAAVAAITTISHPRPPHALLLSALRSHSYRSVSYDAANDLVVFTLLILSMAGVFGGMVYPYAKPQYGGGAAWTVAFLDSLAASPDISAPTGMVLLDEDANRLRLLVCDSSRPKAGRLRAVQIARSQVQVIEPGSPIAVPEFVLGCSRGRHTTSN